MDERDRRTRAVILAIDFDRCGVFLFDFDETHGITLLLVGANDKGSCWPPPPPAGFASVRRQSPAQPAPAPNHSARRCRLEFSAKRVVRQPLLFFPAAMH